MLQNIRDNAQGIVAKVIIGLIVVSFAFFGIESLVGGGNTNNVALVNGEELTAIELNQAVNIQKNRVLSSMGENADPAALDIDRLREPALNQLINQRLLLQAATEASIAVGDATIDQSIVNMPQFHENGQFSAEIFRNILRSNGYSPASFKQLMANDLLIAQLNSGIISSDFVTPKELNSAAGFFGQKRSYRYFVIPQEKIASQVTVDESEVQQYYNEHQQSFKTEDRVKLAYIEIKQQDFFKPVPEELVKEAYAVEMNDFEAGEERRASHILIEINDNRNKEQAAALINKLAKQLSEGDKFSALAEKFSDDAGSARNAGDLGYTSGETFPPEFEKALFALSLNEISEPVLTDAGYHLIQATEIKKVDKPSYEDLKPVLQQRIQMAAAEDEFVRSVDELRDQVFNAEDLTGPAKELALTVSTTEWISKTSADGLMANTKVLDAVYSDDVLLDRNNSEVIELDADHFIVLRVVEYDAAHTREITEVRDEIVSIVKLAKTTALATELAKDAINKLENGQLFEDLAAEKGYEWQPVTDAARNSSAVNREILTAAFQMNFVSAEKVSRTELSLANGNVAVIQLENVVDGEWSDFSDAEQRMIKNELNSGYGRRAMDHFMRSLRDNAEIKFL